MKKVNTKITLVIIVCALFLATGASAEYCAVGKIKGQECSGFVLEACESVQVDAVKGEDGGLHTVNRCYDTVSEYSESKGRCWIRIKSKGGGLFSWVINAATTQPVFFHLDEDGNYEELDVEVLTFKCQRR